MKRIGDFAVGTGFLAFGAVWVLVFWKVVRAAAGPEEGYPLEAILWLLPGLAGGALGVVKIFRKGKG